MSGQIVKKRPNHLIALSLSLFLTACTVGPPAQEPVPAIPLAQPVAATPTPLQESKAYTFQDIPGKVIPAENSDRLEFKIVLPTSFHTQAFAVSEIKFIRIYVQGKSMQQALWNPEGLLPFSPTTAISIPNVPRGTNHVVTAQGYDSNKKLIPAAVIKGVYSSSSNGSSIPVTLKRRFWALGKILETLMTQDPSLASQVNTQQLQDILDPILFGNNPVTGSTFANHPMRINTEMLATHLKTTGGGLPDQNMISTQAMMGLGTANVFLATPSGVNFGENVMVSIKDPNSPTQTILTGSTSPAQATILNVLPGEWELVVTRPGTETVLGQATVTVGKDGSVTLSAGTNTAPLVLSGVQEQIPAPTVGSLTPATARVGETVVVTGTNLNGATSVTFNGVSASIYTVLSPTKIKVDVPLAATTGPVAVTTPGGTVASAGNFTLDGTNTIRYVRSGATGTNDGTSWANAFTTLQAALAASAVGDVIWVAAGTYIPGTNRTDTFNLVDGVRIYGGFNGTETGLSQRSVQNNETVLGGEIGAVGLTDNTHRIVTATGLTSASGTRLDGFTIQDGYVNADWWGGSAILLQTSGGMTIANCLIQNNTATSPSNWGGAIMLNEVNGPVRLENSVVTGNAALPGGGGGGLYVWNGSSNAGSDNLDLLIVNSLFYNNTAEWSGAIGVSVSGSDTVTFEILNSVLYNNSATYPNATYGCGGAIGTWGTTGASPIAVQGTLRNSILWGNTCTNNPNGSQLITWGGTENIEARFSIIQDMLLPAGVNVVTTNGSVFTNTSSSAADPNFMNAADPDGPDNKPGTADDGLRPNTGSPAINGGETSANALIDILGLPRPQQSSFDIGAFEIP